MLDRTPLSDRAQGRWRSILPEFGIDASHLNGKHGPCPFCGGKDRWRFTDRDGSGSWICNQCGSGDGAELVKRSLGIEFREAAKRIEAVLGSAPRLEPPRQRSEQDKRQAMTALWRSGKPLTAGDPAGMYLRKRCGLAEYPACLRHVEALRYHGDGGGRYPVMIAKLTAPDGSPASIHRTYLSLSGGKAPIDDPRRLMPGAVAKGSAVRLGAPGKTLGIAEGIETALSAAALFGVPCWAALTARFLAQWVAPEECEEVIVFGDNDASYTGQAAAYVCAHANARKAKRVRVEIPPRTGQDWDDVRRSGATP